MFFGRRISGANMQFIRARHRINGKCIFSGCFLHCTWVFQLHEPEILHSLVQGYISIGGCGIAAYYKTSIHGWLYGGSDIKPGSTQGSLPLNCSGSIAFDDPIILRSAVVKKYVLVVTLRVSCNSKSSIGRKTKCRCQ